MKEISEFCKKISKSIEDKELLDIDAARDVVTHLNEFLYTNHKDIGVTSALEQDFPYLSDFHKFWEKYHKEILDCQIDKMRCTSVAEALHSIYVRTSGKAFIELYDTDHLNPEEICRIRLLTANQDFRGSRNFMEYAKTYKEDPATFDANNIVSAPEAFLKEIGVSDLSQTDKRISYAKHIAEFVLSHGGSPYALIHCYDNNIYALREALINCQGAGHGNKKTDMFLRDMVVLGVWPDVQDFDKIDVASDVNTIKVALRTGILKTTIPLVSSFLDIFCYQYGYIDEMNALAWRTVWDIWKQHYPDECAASPCLIDYFVYNVVGRQFCRENLYTYLYETNEHTFKWQSGNIKRCLICNKTRAPHKARVISKRMACQDNEHAVAIMNSEFVRSLPDEQKFDNCPFAAICKSKELEPPKSISIMGRTGWTTAYADKNNGGGGLMA